MGANKWIGNGGGDFTVLPQMCLQSIFKCKEAAILSDLQGNCLVYEFQREGVSFVKCTQEDFFLLERGGRSFHFLALLFVSSDRSSLSSLI